MWKLSGAGGLVVVDTLRGRFPYPSFLLRNWGVNPYSRAQPDGTFPGETRSLLLMP